VFNFFLTIGELSSTSKDGSYSLQMSDVSRNWRRENNVCDLNIGLLKETRFKSTFFLVSFT